MNSNKNLREVEVSPDGRYVRFDEKLGNGAYKEVFLAYDTETGKEVAWNTVTLARLPPNEKKRIRMETEILKELDHPHIINFFHVWENPDRDQICFTTEIVTSGTLKQYVHRVRNVKLKVIKKWCRQILTALDYLHIHSPPIIHRDLKCDNIFINGGTGEIRIGDFGLSAARHTTHVESVLGTPEFMAPELYDENYSEGVDIYAFGCCVLEMTTKEYPYEECSNAAQIWKKVSMGQKPEVLSRILNKEVKAFIECCLRPADERLSARELLKHPFLKFKRSDPGRDNITVLVEPRASPTHRQGKDEQREKFQGCMWAREKEKEIEKEKERVDRERDRERLYNPSQTHNNTAAHHRHSPHQNSLDYGGDALISPVSAASSRMPPVAYHPPHINTSTTPTPTHQQQMEHNLHSGAHTDTHPHPHPSPQAQGHHPPSSSHHPSESHPVPNSAQTPPARLNRQISLPTMGQNATGLTHSQSSHAMNSLQHPQPQRLLSTPTVQHPPNLSPDLIHVSSVVVEVESVHSHFANIVLHIHFESGTRRKKQIRFEFDFYRDTSESIASEMVKALKLPDQERTARCIASNMELKIDPFRVEYFQKHHHANPNGTHTDPNSPANSPATKVKSIHPSNVSGTTTAIHATAPSSHKNASPSPQHVAPAASPNSHGVTHKPMVHGSNTLPAPALSKVAPTGQPTGGSTGIRPTSAKPPLSHTLTPQMQRQVQQAVLGGANVMVGAQSSKNPLPPTDAKSLGSRRHSHEPNSSNHWNESDHTHLPASRTSSVPQTVGLGVDPHGHHPSASPIRSANASGSSASSASSNGIRRSSSTSSLALMQAPSSSDEAANKLHHDRLFEEYRKLSIANLKDKIKARIREKRESGQSDGEESDASQEGIELNGILEKSDLIESLIRMTPRHRTELSSSKPSIAVTPSHAPSASSQSHHHSLHHAHSFPSPPSPREHSHDLPSDSSAASTPRIPQAEHSATLDNSASSTNSTPYQRSRTHSIDVHHSNASEMLNENAILGAYANIKPKQSLNTSTTSANNAHPFSPLSSPSQSPVPSPAAKSLQDRHRTSSHADEPFQASSHRMMSSAAGGNGSLLPSSLTRSISSPNQLATTISSYTGSNTFPSNLHVDVHPSHSIHSNPISPSNGQSETSFSPNQIPPPALASTSAGHHGRLNVPSSSTPHGVHPQSPTIPEESDKDEEAVETRKLKQRASPHSNNLPSTFPSEGPYSTPNVHPSNNNFLNHPPTQPHSHSDPKPKPKPATTSTNQRTTAEWQQVQKESKEGGSKSNQV